MELSVTAVRPNPRQPRSHFDEDGLASLTASVREIGVLQPILVRQTDEDEYELIAGERRWRAARRAGMATIPAIIHRVR
jgi:ParB family chromosome partitioning protein